MERKPPPDRIHNIKSSSGTEWTHTLDLGDVSRFSSLPRSCGDEVQVYIYFHDTEGYFNFHTTVKDFNAFAKAWADYLPYKRQ